MIQCPQRTQLNHRNNESKRISRWSSNCSGESVCNWICQRKKRQLSLKWKINIWAFLLSTPPWKRRWRWQQCPRRRQRLSEVGPSQRFFSRILCVSLLFRMVIGHHKRLIDKYVTMQTDQYENRIRKKQKSKCRCPRAWEYSLSRTMQIVTVELTG